jgi:serine/threonine protein kinase
MTQVPVTMAYAPTEALSDGEVTKQSDIYLLGLFMIFVITGKHPFDPAMRPMTLMRAIDRGAKVELPGVKPELTQLIKLMVSVNPEERPESANVVFEEICRNEFAFFAGGS